MKQTVLIVVEGGRIQDIFSDSQDVRVLVKNLDEHPAPADSAVATADWPVAIAGTVDLGAMIDRA